MLLLKAGAISKSSNQIFGWKPSLPSKLSSSSISISNSKQALHGLKSSKYSSLKSISSDDTSSGSSHHVNDEPINMELIEDIYPSEETDCNETVQDELFHENSLLVLRNKISNFFDQINLKISDVYINMHLDSEGSSSVFLYGGTATAALWFATAIVSAIDSIPLVPTLLEVVGFVYTFWFCTRYLIFKSNRDELAAKIEEIKEKVVGSDDD